ncbi:MAG TPA: hypothetical protein VIT89_11715 [Solirubrobacterales bacterium]
MRFKLISAAISAALAISLLGVAGASAATQAGNNCTVNSAEKDITLYGLANAPGNPLSATIPVSGVITKWTFNAPPELEPGFFNQTLKILRRVGGNQFQVIGESASSPLSGGLNTFSTRVPVLAGDIIGSVGTVEGIVFSFYCETGNPGDRLGVIKGNPSLGSIASQSEEGGGYQVPVTVFVEPDADNDGFGDETQDACPQSAAFQTPCPPVALSTSTQVKTNSVTVIVTSTTAAPVTVKGVAKLGKGKKAKMNGGTQNLLPGTLNKYRLFFTKGLKNKLKELSPQKKVTLKVTVSGTSVSGAVTTKTLKLKLKGQAKG